MQLASQLTQIVAYLFLNSFEFLIEDIGMVQKTATVLFCDNQGAIHLSKNPEHHKRTNHIEVPYHYVRKSQSDGIISVQYVSTKNQLADVFT